MLELLQRFVLASVNITFHLSVLVFDRYKSVHQIVLPTSGHPYLWDLFYKVNIQLVTRRKNCNTSFLRGNEFFSVKNVLHHLPL